MKDKHLIFAGAAPDTANLGVNALCYATVANLLSIDKGLDITILDHSKTYADKSYKLSDDLHCNRMGAKYSKRFYEPSSYVNIDLIRRMPFIRTDQKAKFKQADAILDISGGDSFTDLYGPRRFRTISYPKKLAMDYQIPLILLPQTYGPFENAETREEAKKYIKYAEFAFARDKYSFELLKELLDEDFDSTRHLQAVDVAFLLPTTEDSVLRDKSLLPQKKDNEVFGLNISGLIYQNSDMAKRTYGISIDYNALVQSVIEHILQNCEGEVWLIPHVLAPKGHYESDNDACEDLWHKLPKALQSRVHVISGEYDQCDIKGVIKHCDWFCGTRMHSTIGALSNCVPTAGLAYSGKFQGVFESVDQGKSVIDARGQDQQAIYDGIIQSWSDRAATRVELEAIMPKVRAAATHQMGAILDFIDTQG